MKTLSSFHPIPLKRSVGRKTFRTRQIKSALKGSERDTGIYLALRTFTRVIRVEGSRPTFYCFSLHLCLWHYIIYGGFKGFLRSYYDLLYAIQTFRPCLKYIFVEDFHELGARLLMRNYVLAFLYTYFRKLKFYTGFFYDVSME